MWIFEYIASVPLIPSMFKGQLYTLSTLYMLPMTLSIITSLKFSPFFQIRKARYREAEQLAEGHPGTRWEAGVFPLHHTFWVLPAKVNFLEDPSWCLVQSRWSLLPMCGLSAFPQSCALPCVMDKTIPMLQAYHEIWTWVTSSFRDTIWTLDNDCPGSG